MKLDESFYERTDVVKVAKDLLGKTLFTRQSGITTACVIVETEAYSWKERGCHAFGSRKTDRNSIMFANGGHSYVYLCYGIHHLFNVVTNVPGVPEAVLVRALQPIEGIEYMRERRRGVSSEVHLTSGPGKLTKALGIDRKFNGKSLLGDDIWIEDSGFKVRPGTIVASARIGIDYAGEDALLPWRFYLKNNAWVSR